MEAALLVPGVLLLLLAWPSEVGGLGYFCITCLQWWGSGERRGEEKRGEERRRRGEGRGGGRGGGEEEERSVERVVMARSGSGGQQWGK